jgi:hypothetical protein
VLLDDDEELSWSRDRSWLWEEEEVTGEEGLKNKKLKIEVAFTTSGRRRLFVPPSSRAQGTKIFLVNYLGAKKGQRYGVS